MVIYHPIRKKCVLHIIVGNVDVDVFDYFGEEEYVSHTIGMDIVENDVKRFNVIEGG
jgi:hypothetical protein